MTDFLAQRLTMVETQVRANDVPDPRIADAMRAVPREAFVPASRRAVAYADAAIEVAHGRFLLEPRTFAKLMHLAALNQKDSVLDVGCTTGYSSHVLLQLVERVVGLEEDADLLRVAVGSSATGSRRPDFVQGPLNEGFRSRAPYDVIFVNGAVEMVPDALLAQLAEGGRLVTVLRRGELGKACLYLREHGRVSHRLSFDAAAPRLAGFRETIGFVF